MLEQNVTHCPKRILLIKTKPVTVGADATISVWLLGQIYSKHYTYVNKSRTYAITSAPAMTGSVFMPRIRLFLAQCTNRTVKGQNVGKTNCYVLETDDTTVYVRGIEHSFTKMIVTQMITFKTF